MTMSQPTTRLGPVAVAALAIGLLLATACFTPPQRVQPSAAPPSATELAEQRKRSFDQLVARAQAGDAAAQFNLGRNYATANFVPQDLDLARDWVMRSWEQHFLPAGNYLAAESERGRTGMPADQAAAVATYREVLADPKCQKPDLAWRATCAVAARGVAKLIDGDGPAADASRVRADYLFYARFAAGAASARLIELYRDGIGGPVDHARAYFFALVIYAERERRPYRLRLDDATAAAVEQQENAWRQKNFAGPPFLDDPSRSDR